LRTERKETTGKGAHGISPGDQKTWTPLGRGKGVEKNGGKSVYLALGKKPERGKQEGESKLGKGKFHPDKHAWKKKQKTKFRLLRGGKNPQKNKEKKRFKSPPKQKDKLTYQGSDGSARRWVLEKKKDRKRTRVSSTGDLWVKKRWGRKRTGGGEIEGMAKIIKN